MPELPLTGGCLCGAVRYEISEPLRSAGYCHCTRCQRRTGAAASAQGGIVPGSLRWTSGEELIKTWWPADDGFGKSFCAECGSHLCSRDPEKPGEVFAVRLGTFDGDPGVRPSVRRYVANAAVWEPLPDDGLERVP
jgi:hypothetical protein